MVPAASQPERERGGRAANKEPRGWVDQYKLAQRRRSRASRRRVTIEVAPSFSNVLALSVYPSPSKQRTTKELQISLRNSQEPTHTKLTRYNNNVPLSCFHQRSSRAIHFCVSSDAPKNGNFFFFYCAVSLVLPCRSLPQPASQPDGKKNNVKDENGGNERKSTRLIMLVSWFGYCVVNCVDVVGSGPLSLPAAAILSVTARR